MPTLAQVYQTYRDALDNGPLAGSAITPGGAGEVLVAHIVTADTTMTPAGITDSGQGLTWTSRATYTVSSHTKATIYTAVTTSSTTLTPTVSFTGGSVSVAFVVKRWTSAALATTPITQSASSGSASFSVNSLTAGSAWDWNVGDWSAQDGTTRTYRGTATEDGYRRVSTQYTFYTAKQTATAGTNAFGLSAPTGQTAGGLGIEILHSGGTGASVTPAVVAATASVGSATMSVGSIVAAAVVAAVATVGAPIVSIGVKPTPAMVAAAASIPTPTVTTVTGASVSPPRVSGVASVGSPTVSAASNASASPAVVAVAAAINAATVTTTSTASVSPSVVNTAASIATPTVSGSAPSYYYAAADPVGATTNNDGQPGGINVGSVVKSTVDIPALGVRYVRNPANDGDTVTVALFDSGSANSTPLATQTHVQTSGDGSGWVEVLFPSSATIIGGGEFEAVAHFPSGNYWASTDQAGLTGQSFQGPLSIKNGANNLYLYGAFGYPPTSSNTSVFLSVDVIAEGAGSPADANVSPAVVAGVAAIGSVTVSAASNATVTPSVVAAVASIPAPTVTAGGSVSAAPAMVVGAVSIPAPTMHTGSRVTAVVVSGTTSIPAPTVTTATGALVTPSVVAAVAYIPAMVGTVSILVTPPVVAGVTAIPAPSVVTAGNATVSPPRVSGIVSIPAPTVQTGTLAVPAVVAGVASIPAPTVTTFTGVVVTPPRVSGIVAIPAVTVTGNAVALISPATVLARAIIAQPAVQVGPRVKITTRLAPQRGGAHLGAQSSALTRLGSQR